MFDFLLHHILLVTCYFDVCITELRDGLINVVHAEEYPRPDEYQCQTAKERYEEAVGTLSVTEIPYYLSEYQQACNTD
jgi:hypothetical protein